MLKKTHFALMVGSILLTSVLKAQDTAKGINDPRAHQHHQLGLPIPPSFPGGKDSLAAFLAKNVHYPAMAAKKHVTGTITVSFTVEVDGSLTNIKLDKPLCYSCDNEAIRVVKSMPKWKPCMDGRNPKAMDYSLDITFAPPENNKPKHR
jgi:TonB family protein